MRHIAIFIAVMLVACSTPAKKPATTPATAKTPPAKTNTQVVVLRKAIVLNLAQPVLDDKWDYACKPYVPGETFVPDLGHWAYGQMEFPSSQWTQAYAGGTKFKDLPVHSVQVHSGFAMGFDATGPGVPVGYLNRKCQLSGKNGFSMLTQARIVNGTGEVNVYLFDGWNGKMDDWRNVKGYGFKLTATHLHVLKVNGGTATELTKVQIPAKIDGKDLKVDQWNEFHMFRNADGIFGMHINRHEVHLGKVITDKDVESFKRCVLYLNGRTAQLNRLRVAPHLEQ